MLIQYTQAFFSLSKTNYVICWLAVLFSDRLKIIVHTLYGNRKFLVVACLFSSDETILSRPSISVSFYFFLFVKRPLAKKKNKKKQEQQQENNWQNHDNFADSKESCTMFLIFIDLHYILRSVFSFLYLIFRLLSFYPYDL